jgi:uncharacterized protein YdaU (DUF1376 family)
MPSTPWFKLYASDYLVDGGIDSMPREAEALLVRMWCICHLEGSCPDDPEELARKTRCSLQYVLQCKRHCQSLFELHEGRLYSRRMEAEKRRSKQASKNANKRYEQKSSTFGTANGSADGIADSDYDSNSLKELSEKNQFNSTEVAHIICQKNGWSGRGLIEALKAALEFQSKQMPEASREQVGEWLVNAYFERKATKGDFAGGPQKFFEQALYTQGRPSPSARSIPGSDLVSRTRAQLEAN